MKALNTARLVELRAEVCENKGWRHNRFHTEVLRRHDAKHRHAAKQTVSGLFRWFTGETKYTKNQELLVTLEEFFAEHASSYHLGDCHLDTPSPDGTSLGVHTGRSFRSAADSGTPFLFGLAVDFQSIDGRNLLEFGTPVALRISPSMTFGTEPDFYVDEEGVEVPVEISLRAVLLALNADDLELADGTVSGDKGFGDIGQPFVELLYMQNKTWSVRLLGDAEQKGRVAVRQLCVASGTLQEEDHVAAYIPRAALRVRELDAKRLPRREAPSVEADKIRNQLLKRALWEDRIKGSAIAVSRPIPDPPM